MAPTTSTTSVDVTTAFCCVSTLHKLNVCLQLSTAWLINLGNYLLRQTKCACCLCSAVFLTGEHSVRARAWRWPPPLPPPPPRLPVGSGGGDARAHDAGCKNCNREVFLCVEGRARFERIWEKNALFEKKNSLKYWYHGFGRTLLSAEWQRLHSWSLE